MLSYIQKHSQNAIIGALVASIIALFGSIVSVYLTYHYSTVAQDRQIRLEQLSKFDASSSQIIEAAGTFIAAVNDNKDLDQAKQKLSAVLAAQIYDTDNLRKFYGSRVGVLIKDYQSAISELNQVAQKTSSVTEMRPWAESFGRVLDAKINLSRQLYSTIGINERAEIPNRQAQFA